METAGAVMATAAEEVRHSRPITENRDTSVSFSPARKSQDSPWTLGAVYLQCYFLTIATILGTGILGLPVTIAHAGLMPFLVSFLTGFVMQALLIYLFVDLLQRCRAAQIESLKCVETERILMQDVSLEEPSAPDAEEGEVEDVEEADTGLLQKDATALKLREELQPNLHMLGVLFLSKRCSRVFDLVLLSQLRLSTQSMSDLDGSSLLPPHDNTPPL
ncbi:hypothetical protein AOLI_G00151960 [Acnodon oligacanthus]